jgi:hypothetical protein
MSGRIRVYFEFLGDAKAKHWLQSQYVYQFFGFYHAAPWQIK